MKGATNDNDDKQASIVYNTVGLESEVKRADRREVFAILLAIFFDAELFGERGSDGARHKCEKGPMSSTRAC